ncbi:UbiA prenyltransferase family-domain-containing protein [Mycena leptocephala]|nr:UbiA prenyltransferase family-domain-containing protein [Mycena leptocephala]KAJ7903036.1 UbiA prenyltransferase family-domain-containing protein [Mycena leptocephala]
MVCRAQPELSSREALLRAAVYVPLRLGAKSPIMTVDDLLDYDIDALVERTKNRPLPRGAITLRHAWIFFGMQVVLGVYLAVTTLSRTALYTSMAVWPLYIIYPTCKGWTNLAPIPLSAFSWVGEDGEPDPRILAGLGGYVFDVSTMKEQFGPTNFYNKYAGKDISAALAKFSLDDVEASSRSNLSEKRELR